MQRWEDGVPDLVIQSVPLEEKKLRRGGFVFFGCFRCQKLPNYIYGCMLPQIKGKTKASQNIRFPGHPCYLPHFPRDVQIFQRWLCYIEIESGTDLLLYQLFAPSKYLDLVIPLSWECLPEKMGRKKEAGILFHPQTVKSQI